MKVYTSLFADGQVLSVRHRPAEASDEGMVELAEFVLAGRRFRCSDSPIEHAWKFTPAVSVWVDCESTGEQRRVFDALLEDGREHMPLGDHGSVRCQEHHSHLFLRYLIDRCPIGEPGDRPSAQTTASTRSGGSSTTRC